MVLQKTHIQIFEKIFLAPGQCESGLYGFLNHLRWQRTIDGVGDPMV